MVADYLMYQVNKVWYHIFWGYMLVCSVFLLILCGLVQINASTSYLATVFNLDNTTLILAGASTAYLLSGFWLLAKRSLPLATLCGSMLFGLILFNGFTQTLDSNGVYFFAWAWAAAAFFNAIFGLPLLLGATFLTIVFTLQLHGFQITQMGAPSLFLAGTHTAVATGAYLFWRKRFIDIQGREVDQLTGLLRSNQQQSEILIQSIGDGVVVINNEGKIVLMNPAASILTGWDIKDAMGIDVQLVIKIDNENGTSLEEGSNPFAKVLASQKPFTKSFQLTSRSDTKSIVSLVLSPVAAPGTGVVAVMRDISDERAAEQQRAEFISTASHEMRTPIAAIEGYLALSLNEKVSSIDSRARTYLEKAYSSTRHLGDLFQDLLTSSKAEDGRLTNHPVVVEMGSLMQQLSDDLKFAAEKKGLLAEFVVGSSNITVDTTNKDASQSHMIRPLYYVHADPDRLREVVTNLFDNACKYTPEGKISLGLTGDNEVVQIYVRDTGAGIPAEDISHLFQKFYRVDNSATRTIGGTGLGLFICRKIIELYQGRIWVESEVGKGSTFFINLPRLTTSKALELQAAENRATPGQP